MNASGLSYAAYQNEASLGNAGLAATGAPGGPGQGGGYFDLSSQGYDQWLNTQLGGMGYGDTSLAPAVGSNYFNAIAGGSQQGLDSFIASQKASGDLPGLMGKLQSQYPGASPSALQSIAQSQSSAEQGYLDQWLNAGGYKNVGPVPGWAGKGLANLPAYTQPSLTAAQQTQLGAPATSGTSAAASATPGNQLAATPLSQQVSNYTNILGAYQQPSQPWGQAAQGPYGANLATDFAAMQGSAGMGGYTSA